MVVLDVPSGNAASIRMACDCGKGAVLWRNCLCGHHDEPLGRLVDPPDDRYGHLHQQYKTQRLAMTVINQW